MSTKLGLGIVVTLILLVIAVAAAGCAAKPVPYCERWDAKVLARDGKVLGMYFDGPNAEKLVDMLLGLAHGTCRLPPRDGVDL